MVCFVKKKHWKKNKTLKQIKPVGGTPKHIISWIFDAGVGGGGSFWFSFDCETIFNFFWQVSKKISFIFFSYGRNYKAIDPQRLINVD